MLEDVGMIVGILTFWSEQRLPYQDYGIYGFDDRREDNDFKDAEAKVTMARFMKEMLFSTLP